MKISPWRYLEMDCHTYNFSIYIQHLFIMYRLYIPGQLPSMTLLSVQGGICWRQAWSRNSGSCYSKVWADRRASCCIRGRGIPHRCQERHLDRNSTSSLPMSLDHPVRFERGTTNKKILFYKGWGMFIKKLNFPFSTAEVFKTCWKSYYKSIVVLTALMTYW